MAQCPACHNSGRRLNPALILETSIFGKRVHNPLGLPLFVTCTECVGGIASCCDAAGSAQPEPRAHWCEHHGHSYVLSCADCEAASGRQIAQ
jgi:hypothetical protein